LEASRTAEHPGLPSGYESLRVIPTNQGRTVHVARTRGGDQVLAKVAHTDEWALDIAEQVRHFSRMGRLLGADSVYPEVLESRERLLIMPFYSHGSLDDLSLGDDHSLVLELTTTALHALFHIATVQPPGFVPDAAWTEAASSFVPSQVAKRMARLEDALQRFPGWLAEPTADGTRQEAVTDAVAWVAGGALADAAHRLAPPALGLAAHGDFGLNNIMLAGPPALGARIVFIDTRGLWHGGWAWWDPIMDLATLITFHCRIEPALAAAGELSPRILRARGRLTEQDILDAVTADKAFEAWAARDPGWRERLEVDIAIRLLGNVSVQLLTAPRNGELRAAAVLELLRAQSARVQEVLS
jgi:hypothetical protein